MGKLWNTRVPGVISAFWIESGPCGRVAYAILLSRIKPHARTAVPDSGNKHFKCDMSIRGF